MELGQLSALAVMLILISLWRNRDSFQTFSLVTNYTLILLGGYLFFMQMHGYEHTANAEELMVATGESPSSIQATTVREDATRWKDTLTVSIPARGDKEYKLFVYQGASFRYHWKTEGTPLFYDFHGEPANDTSGYFESFAKGTESQASGSITATFDGTHGWYWKNSSREPVVVTLKVAGAYSLKEVSLPPADIQPTAKEIPSTHQSIF